MGAREQLVKAKRSLGNQMRGLLRPFGVKLPLRAGMKKFADAAYRATQADPLLNASVRASLEALAAIELQLDKLDDAQGIGANEVARRLMSVPGVGPITALAFVATIEKVERFKRTRDIGVYLGLTEKRYQSARQMWASAYPSKATPWRGIVFMKPPMCC